MNQFEVTPQDFRLGNSARVKINAALLKEGAEMSYAKKRELRIEIIKGVIRSKPAGVRIRTVEFRNLLHINNANVTMFLRNLVDKGIIGRLNISPRTFSYYIPGDAKTISNKPLERLPTESTQKELEDILEAERSIHAAQPITENILTHRQQDILKAAKDFAWAFPDEHNDLRKFISWYFGR